MRDNYFSFMKGLAIIGVLFIHTPFMIGDGTAGIASRQLVTFAVAMFFFLSGYFVKDDRLDLKGISRIGIPYILWSILWFAETTFAGSQPVTTWKIINSIFFGGAKFSTFIRCCKFFSTLNTYYFVYFLFSLMFIICYRNAYSNNVDN